LLLLCALVLSVAGLWYRDASADSGNGGEPLLSLERAVHMALDRSHALRSAAYEVDRGYEVRKFAADRVKYSMRPIEGPTTPEADRAFTALVQADLAWQMAKRSYEAQKDTVVMSVYRAYAGVLQAQARLRAAEAQALAADWQYRATNAMFMVGAAARPDVAKAEADRDAALKNLESARGALADAYHALNQLIGLEPDARPVLETRVEVRPLVVENLEAAVSRALESSPTVWLAQQRIDLARLTLDLYNFADPNRTEPYEAKEIDVSKAEVSAADTKEQMARLVRAIYFAARQAENGYGAALDSLAKAREDLRLAEIRYSIGMATRMEVEAARARVAQAEQSVVQYAWQHEVLRLAFEKPWAYAGASTGGGSTSSSG
jgi:outer membrane protein TolC